MRREFAHSFAVDKKHAFGRREERVGVLTDASVERSRQIIRCPDILNL
jgi:hypothetical protein